MLIFCLPNQGVELSKIESIIREEIGKAQAGDITQAELDRVRTNQRVNVIRSLDDNSGIAGQFARARMIDGDWRSVFTDLDKYDQVTLDDLKRVANQYLVKQNRTVGMIQNNAK
jgi:predicted Zn-dependent peptidase